MGRSSGFLLHSIIDALVDDLFHILVKIVGNLRDLEDDVFNEQLAIAKEISLLRREITLLRRIVFPLKRIMAYLTNIIQKSSEEDLTLYYDDVRDHIDEIIEVLGESQETIEIYKDTDFMLSTEKTNKILAVLTIIFTLSIPVALVGALWYEYYPTWWNRGWLLEIPWSIHYAHCSNPNFDSTSNTVVFSKTWVDPNCQTAQQLIYFLLLHKQ